MHVVGPQRRAEQHAAVARGWEEQEEAHMFESMLRVAVLLLLLLGCSAALACWVRFFGGRKEAASRAAGSAAEQQDTFIHYSQSLDIILVSQSHHVMMTIM